MQRDVQSYAGSHPNIPLAGYATALGIYSTIFGGLLLRAALRRSLPRRIGFSDVALLAVATHELTRILTRDVVTSPIRAPFARFEGRAGAGEVNEEPRGEGAQRAIGELLTCPFCAAPWVAAGLTTALLWNARATRLVMAVFAAAGGSDFLQQLYSRARHPVSGR